MEITYLADDSAIREHLDLVIAPALRHDRSAFFILCDGVGRPLAHVCVDDVDPDPLLEECELIVDPFATALAQEKSDGSVLLALTRPGSAGIDPVDRRWFRAAQTTCRRAGVAVLGVYVLTAHGIVEMHPDDAR